MPTLPRPRAIRTGNRARCSACRKPFARFAGEFGEFVILPNWPEPTGGIWQAPARSRRRPRKATRVVLAPVAVRCPECGIVADIGREPAMNELIREQIAAARESRAS